MNFLKFLKGGFERCYSFVYGIKKADYEQVAFDLVLKDFGIHNYNIVKISSILPKGFRYRERISKLPEEGNILYMAYIWRFFSEENFRRFVDMIKLIVPYLSKETFYE